MNLEKAVEAMREHVESSLLKIDWKNILVPVKVKSGKVFMVSVDYLVNEGFDEQTAAQKTTQETKRHNK